jgi:orotate phosphoribosyltransferase
MTDSDRALATLIARLSYRKGTFRLASGRESDFYVDVKQTVFTSTGSELVGRALCSRLEPAAITSVGGMAVGAIPLVSAALSEAARRGYPLEGFFVRKEVKDHGTSAKLDGRFDAGARIALVEDVVTTGESTLRAVDAVEGAGGTVAQIVVVVDREENDGMARLRARVADVQALLTRTEIIGAAG